MHLTQRRPCLEHTFKKHLPIAAYLADKMVHFAQDKKTSLRYMRRYGTSYYYATLFFPRRIKRDVMTLYAFVRIPDLIVDVPYAGPEGAALARTQLEDMRASRSTAYTTQNRQDPIRGESVNLFLRCKIPFQLSRDFWDAMITDTHILSYETYDQLRTYMYGSAMVVGEMMCYVVGTHDIPAALPAAHALGEAMQLTNFLRDVREDRVELQRIYMPNDDLGKYGLSDRHVKEFCTTGFANTNREAYCAYQIQRCDILYQTAYNGIHHLPPTARLPVKLAAKLYQRILRRIEAHHYNVFHGSMRTTSREKFWTVITNILS